MAADWLAGIAAQTAATQAGEAAKTAAVTAGAAARAGAEAAESAGSNATTINSILKTITASASETFAGIFGFLSPVLGPAAAGPAAAGEATVLSAIPHYDTGAWSLPGDMVAQVHQGEMIIPAGPASTFRNMMEGNSGVAGTVHVHHAVNFNVQAMDGHSVRQFLKNNSKQILRTVNESVRTGSHLGLSKLGTA